MWEHRSFGICLMLHRLRVLNKRERERGIQRGEREIERERERGRERNKRNMADSLWNSYGKCYIG